MKNFISSLFAIFIAVQATAASNLESGLDELASQIVSQTSSGEAVTIAVSPFRHSDDRCSEMSNFIADELIYSLLITGKGKVSIVERSQLQSIFEELEFNLSGAVDTQTAQQLGKLYGVDALVLGSINTLGSQLRLTSRMVDTGTGTVKSAARTSVPITDEVNELMSERGSFACSKSLADGPGTNVASSAVASSAIIASNSAIPDISAIAGRWIGRSSCDGTFSFSANSLSSTEIALSDDRNPRDNTGKIFFESLLDDGKVQVAFHKTGSKNFAMDSGQKLILKSLQELVSPEDSKCEISLIRTESKSEAD